MGACLAKDVPLRVVRFVGSDALFEVQRQVGTVMSLDEITPREAGLRKVEVHVSETVRREPSVYGKDRLYVTSHVATDEELAQEATPEALRVKEYKRMQRADLAAAVEKAEQEQRAEERRKVAAFRKVRAAYVEGGT